MGSRMIVPKKDIHTIHPLVSIRSLRDDAAQPSVLPR